ncbi:MAG: hypothetical protein KF774_15575 [Planctomyces sp.]|nr:hypothetical protein [Planctomyces sp.]
MCVRCALAAWLSVLALSGCASPKEHHLSFVADRPARSWGWPFGSSSKSRTPADTSAGSAPTAGGRAREKGVAESIDVYLSTLDPQTRLLAEQEFQRAQSDADRQRLLSYLLTVDPRRVPALLQSRQRERPAAEAAPDASLAERLADAPSIDAEVSPAAGTATPQPVTMALIEQDAEPLPSTRRRNPLDVPNSASDAAGPDASSLDAPASSSAFSRLRQLDPRRALSFGRASEDSITAPEAPAAPALALLPGRRPRGEELDLASRLANPNGAPAAAPHPQPGNRSPDAGAHPAFLQEELQRLISMLEADVARLQCGPTFAEREEYIQRHVQLRMLYLMANEPQLAQQSIPGIDATTQEYWTSVMCALASSFDQVAIPDPSDRAAAALHQLRTAAQLLQTTSRLEVPTLAFCDKIDGYGLFHPFPRDVFRPGQPVLLYAEVRNFRTESTASGNYRTLLRSTIEVLRKGPDGELLERRTFEPTEDLSRSARNDYFHSYKLDLPGDLSPGPHSVRLTLEDELSGKIGTATIDFMVR